MMEEYAVVVGGMNMDICGMPAERPLMRDSNIGQIKQSIGGVGQKHCSKCHAIRLSSLIDHSLW